MTRLTALRGAVCVQCKVTRVAGCSRELSTLEMLGAEGFRAVGTLEELDNPHRRFVRDRHCHDLLHFSSEHRAFLEAHRLIQDARLVVQVQGGGGGGGGGWCVGGVTRGGVGSLRSGLLGGLYATITAATGCYLQRVLRLPRCSQTHTGELWGGGRGGRGAGGRGAGWRGAGACGLLAGGWAAGGFVGRW